ncbi:hypothetical protein KAR48_03215 [bacterium]|nr:hypothetical protein [bacterium]
MMRLSDEKTMKLVMSVVAAMMLMMVIIGCEQSDPLSNMDTKGDAQLIAAIQDAINKEVISITELPLESQGVLNGDYMDHYIDDALVAPTLGYEVGMRQERGHEVGERTAAYFSTDGRQLNNGAGGPEGRGGRKPRGGKNKQHVQFVYPVVFIMPDGSTITGNDEKEVGAAIRDWYDANPEVTDRPQLQFPVDVILEDGSLLTISTEEEMKELKSQYREDHQGPKPPFHFVYPISYVMPDGSLITLNSQEGFENVRQWHTDNPEVEEKGQLQFPVSIILRDSSTVTVNNQEEFDELKKSQGGQHGNAHEPPFTFVYPITMTMPDGTVFIIESRDGMDVVRQWHTDNPEIEGKGIITFPVTVILADGTELVINNDEEMETLRSQYGGHGGRGHGGN